MGNMNGTDGGGSFVVHIRVRHLGIMCRNQASTIPPVWGESSPSSKLTRDGGVMIHISCVVTTYKFIINCINILISYID